MPLDDLVSVIETLQQRIRDHGATLRENETRTRMALIDPLLTALGWDVSDPALVTPEYGAGDGRADYALLNEGRPAALIEAKHLNEPLERARHQDQVFGYARRSRIKFAGITDGNIWVLEDLSVFEGEPRILDISIENMPSYECALKLLMLWRPNLASAQPVQAEKPLFAFSLEPQATSASTVDVPLEFLSVPTHGATPQEPSGWIRLSEFNPPTGENAPSLIRFLDGSTAEIGSWKRIPLTTAQWLYSQQLLTAENIPVPSGTRGFAANSAPVHSNGSPMPTYESIGDGRIFINVHLSARAARENAKKLLNHCGVDPSTVQLQVEQ